MRLEDVSGLNPDTAALSIGPMHGLGRILWGGAWIAILLGGISSCRKPSDTVKSDLGEAGYQLTTVDWFRAAATNDTAALEKFVAAGFAADTRDASGDSALHAAASAGAKEAADFLLDRGLAVDQRGASERTPLMAAVAGNQTAMVGWLLRQGADPRLKDKDGFVPLMLAVRDGKSGAVADLAPHNRENLDPAILLAALVGQAGVIDTLTSYGASVYARMEDGRTPLMIAAENGHEESVKLLLDLGASRLSIDTEGRNAADLANQAGHPEIAALINRDPLPQELTLESPAEVAQSMDALLNASLAETPPGAAGTGPANQDPAVTPPAAGAATAAPAKPIQGEVLAPGVATTGQNSATADPPAAASAPAMPNLVMRHYREREIPVQVRAVEGETAILNIVGRQSREVKVRSGETIPGSRLVVLRVQRRMEDSKLNVGQTTEVSVVEVRDSATGTTREWISGVSASAHDPVALVEDATSGQRYTASPGQRFKSADGTEFIISDVRPNQLVIEEVASGNVQTLPLRGPRG
jgi:ankyrin repeat protein